MRSRSSSFRSTPPGRSIAATGQVRTYPPIPPPMDDLIGDETFVMNLSSAANGPLYGFLLLGDHTSVRSHTFVSGGGPSGRNRIDVQMLEFSGLPPGGSPDSNRAGWDSGNIGPITQGQSVFIRYYIGWDNFNVNRLDCLGNFYGGKFFIIGANPDTERTIGGNRGPGPIQFGPRIERDWCCGISKNINGYPDGTFGTDPPDPPMIGPPQVINQWNAYQIEIKLSATTSSGDGGYKIWQNNDVYTNPNAISAFTTNMNALAWNSGGNASISLIAAVSAPGIGFGFTYRIAAFNVGPTFHSNWFGNM